MDEKQLQLVRAMDDREIRLNCVLCAVSASTYTRSRLTDPLTIAQEFYEWVTQGKLTPTAAVQFGGRPAEVTEGYLSGGPSQSAEAERAAASQNGDLIDVAPRPPRR